MAKRRLLLIDDDPAIAELVGEIAEPLGYEVTATRCAEDFKASFAAHRPDLIMVDVVMPETDGIELVSWLAENRCTARVLVITGYAALYARAAQILAQTQGLMRVVTLEKPLKLAALRAALSDEGQ